MKLALGVGGATCGPLLALRRWMLAVVAGLILLMAAPEASAVCSEDVTQKPSSYHYEIVGQCPDKASAIAACVAEGAKHGYALTTCDSGYTKEYGAHIWAGWFHWQKGVQTTPFTFVIYSYTPTERVQTNRNLGACEDGCFGDPVNAGTGNKYESHVEFRGSGEHPLEVSWTYNSKTDPSAYRIPAASIFGRNRTHFYARYLRRFQTAGSNMIYVYRPNGNAIKFSRSGEAWVSTDEGDLKDIVVDGVVIGWSLVNSDGQTEYFDSAGKLSALVDIRGRRHSIVYDANARPSKVIDDRGRELRFEYDTYSLVKSIVRPDGGQILFTYSTGTDLTKVTYPGGSSVQYQYDESGYDPSSVQGALTGVIDEAGTRSSSTWYDSTGRAIKTQLADGVDATSATYVSTAAGTSNTSATVTLPSGATKQFSFSVMGGRVLTIGSTTTCAGCQARQTTYTRDANGRPDVVTVNGLQTDYDFGSSGLLVQKIEAANDPSHKRTVQTDWHATFAVPTERRTYDAAGVLVEREVWTYNSRGQVLTHAVHEL